MVFETDLPQMGRLGLLGGARLGWVFARLVLRVRLPHGVGSTSGLAGVRVQPSFSSLLRLARHRMNRWGFVVWADGVVMGQRQVEGESSLSTCKGTKVIQGLLTSLSRYSATTSLNPSLHFRGCDRCDSGLASLVTNRAGTVLARILMTESAFFDSSHSALGHSIFSGIPKCSSRSSRSSRGTQRNLRKPRA